MRVARRGGLPLAAGGGGWGEGEGEDEDAAGTLPCGSGRAGRSGEGRRWVARPAAREPLSGAAVEEGRGGEEGREDAELVHMFLVRATGCALTASFNLDINMIFSLALK